MQRIASTPDERVTQMLASGRQHEIAGDLADAVEWYQRILDDPQLAGAVWRGQRLSVLAELEATRRIEQAIRVAGRSVYVAQEQAAKQRFEELRLLANPPREELQLLAAQYPLASVTPSVYASVASAARDVGDPMDAIGALEDGLRAARRQGEPDRAAVGELGGQLIALLTEREQLSSAARALRSFLTTFPGVAPTVDGVAVDPEVLSVEIRSRLAEMHRWPSLGTVERDAPPQVLADWVLLPPLIRDREGEAPNCVCMESIDSIGLWRVTAGEPVTRLWTRSIGAPGTVPIRVTRDAAYIFFPDGGGRVVKVDVRTGKERWESKPFRKLVAPAKLPAARDDTGSGVHAARR